MPARLLGSCLVHMRPGTRHAEGPQLVAMDRDDPLPALDLVADPVCAVVGSGTAPSACDNDAVAQPVAALPKIGSAAPAFAAAVTRARPVSAACAAVITAMGTLGPTSNEDRERFARRDGDGCLYLTAATVNAGAGWSACTVGDDRNARYVSRYIEVLLLSSVFKRCDVPLEVRCTRRALRRRQRNALRTAADKNEVSTFTARFTLACDAQSNAKAQVTHADKSFLSAAGWETPNAEYAVVIIIGHDDIAAFYFELNEPLGGGLRGCA